VYEQLAKKDAEINEKDARIAELERQLALKNSSENSMQRRSLGERVVKNKEKADVSHSTGSERKFFIFS
jgi:hypothetical protein